MAKRTRLLDCPSCGKQLEDTKEFEIICKYCGFTFNREESAREDEEYIRRRMVVDLRTDMEIYKMRKKLSTIFMVASFAMGLPLLFSEPFQMKEVILLILFLMIGFSLFLLFLFYDKRYETTRSAASDLSMRRR